MFKQNVLLIVFLAIINIAWIVVFILNKLNFKKKVDELREAKKKAGLEINEKDLKDEVEPNSWYTWAIGIAICLNVWIVGAIVTYAWSDWYFVGDRDNIDNNKAIFGDSFGAVNALISAFAFGGMIVNFYFQRYELKLQRKELEAQRKEFTAQRMEFEQQNQTLGLQRFENTFFNMLHLQQEMVAGLEYKPLRVIPLKDPGLRPSYKGREVFKAIFESEVKPSLESEGIESYCRQENISLLDHYFRHFYTILNFIDKSPDINKFSRQSEAEIIDKKYDYAKILRATLSRYELVLIYYNGLSDFGKEKLRPLIEKYSMLNNINEGLLALSSDNIPGDFLPDERVIRETFVKNCGCINYPPTDYLFYISKEDDDTSGYKVCAFYHNEDEQQKEMEKKTNFDRDLNELKNGDFSEELFKE